MFGSYNPVGKDLENLLCTVPAVRISIVRSGEKVELFATVGNDINFISSIEVNDFSQDGLWTLLKSGVQDLTSKLSSLSNEELSEISKDSVLGMHFQSQGEPPAQPRTQTPTGFSQAPSALGSSYLAPPNTGVHIAASPPPSQQDAVQAALDALNASSLSFSYSSPVQSDDCSSLPPETQKRIQVLSKSL